MKAAAVTLVALFVGACCWMAKRDCFPPCPPATVTKIEVPCKLPPKLLLEAVKRQAEGCPEKMVCYDIPNAGLIAKNVAALKDWIREVRARCEKGVDSGPTSQAGSDAGTRPRAPGDSRGER